MFKEMDKSQRDEVIKRFCAETGAKSQGGGQRYKKGLCPQCGQKSLWIFGDNPWKIQCDKLNSCNYEISTRDHYPDIFENFSKRFAAEMETDPRAIAKAYLREARGFNTAICNQFTQETYLDYKSKASTPTVRFSMSGDGYWERLIENLESFDKKAHFKKGYLYQGLAWTFADLDVKKISELWVVEGIFDAIALKHHSIDAISAMTANNFPKQTLTRLYQANPKLKLVIALDSDAIGKKQAVKWVEYAEDIGFRDVVVAITGGFDDWNDKHLKEQFKYEDIEKYFYNGALLTAKSPIEKAMLMYEHNNLPQFYLEFGNKTYWIKVDAGAMLKAKEDGADDKDTFKNACTVMQIANCTMDILYSQQEIGTNERYYFLNIEMERKSNKDAFSTKHLASASEFKARIMNTVSGAIFTGDTKHLETLYSVKTEHIRDIKTIDFMGYAREVNAYIFENFAVKNSVVYKINKDEYFELPSDTFVKTTFEMPDFAPVMEYQNTWSDDYFDVFGVKGIAVLAYWLGTLFAEQIRDVYNAYPFLELTGEANAGKSTLLKFLWKLVGRADYEGVNPNQGTKVGYLRTLAQVANLPTVMIECEGFDLEDLKTLFNGGHLRMTGQKNMGNKTNMPRFRSALVLSQNERAVTEGSRDNQLALLQRLVYVHFDTLRHTPERRRKSHRLETTPVDEVSGFLVEALKRETEIMKIIEETFEVHQTHIMSLPDVKTTRIGQTHGLMLSLLDALSLVINIPEHLKTETASYIDQIAVDRQVELKQDHPVLEQFWDVYEYLDTQNYQVNHSRNPEYIAINLPQFTGLAAEMRQQLDDIKTIKKLLPNTSRYKFLEHNRNVNSRYAKPKKSMLGEEIESGEKPLLPGHKYFNSIRCYYFHKKPANK